MGTKRGEADEVRMAVWKGGAITRPTLDRLLMLLAEKTTHECHIAVEVVTPTMLKTIDNEDDALETIRRLEAAPPRRHAASMRCSECQWVGDLDKHHLPQHNQGRAA
jgi:hypothetical protein